MYLQIRDIKISNQKQAKAVVNQNLITKINAVSQSHINTKGK